MPIYIHSLFRSGSTYFFNKFREFDENYQCYQEPFNEHLLNAKENPDKLLEVHEDTSKVLRHPILNKPYFYEFHSIAKDVSKYLDESLCYKKFFDSEDGEGNLKKGGSLLCQGVHVRYYFFLFLCFCTKLKSFLDPAFFIYR